MMTDHTTVEGLEVLVNESHEKRRSLQACRPERDKALSLMVWDYTDGNHDVRLSALNEQACESCLVVVLEMEHLELSESQSSARDHQTWYV